MSALGRFLEFSVPVPDLGASLDFYLRLGFTEVRVNDIRPRGYAAVTDGQIVLGLHGVGLEEPALSFVKPDLARHARALVDTGTELAFQRLDDDQFNEIGLRTPDGQLMVLLEAPTFSTADDDVPAPVIGRCTEVALNCTDLPGTRTFFAAAGFLATEGDDETAVLLAAPGLAVTLRQVAGGHGVGLCFEPRGAWRSLIESHGVTGRSSGRDYVLTAPEGTRLLLKSTLS